MRSGDRPVDSLRPVSVDYGVQLNADGSALIKMGNTHVLCGVTVEAKVPPFLKGSGQGWITAEYGMLPCATHSRGRREAVSGLSGRTHEIQRLIGRSLRMMVDLRLLGEHTLRIDCDVLNADGGTRCASITGSALALRQALRKISIDIGGGILRIIQSSCILHGRRCNLPSRQFGLGTHLRHASSLQVAALDGEAILEGPVHFNHINHLNAREPEHRRACMLAQQRLDLGLEVC